MMQVAANQLVVIQNGGRQVRPDYTGEDSMLAFSPELVESLAWRPTAEEPVRFSVGVGTSTLETLSAEPHPSE